jgi:hypothetical protein
MNRRLFFMEGVPIMDENKTTNGKLVYIASPYAGDVDTNVEFARCASRYCIEQGHTPIAVHLLYPQILDDLDPGQRQTGLSLGRHILEKCDEMWVCGDIISPGMSAEITEAGKLGIPIRQVSAERIHGLPDLNYSMRLQ